MTMLAMVMFRVWRISGWGVSLVSCCDFSAFFFFFARFLSGKNRKPQRWMCVRLLYLVFIVHFKPFCCDSDNQVMIQFFQNKPSTTVICCARVRVTYYVGYTTFVSPVGDSYSSGQSQYRTDERRSGGAGEHKRSRGGIPG